MAQGWDLDFTASTITFYEAPANLVAIVVTRFDTASYNATDLWAYSAWNPGFGYPGEVEFYSDRLIWAGTPAQPQTLFMSKAGDYANHGKTTPLLDSDGITITINARLVQPIRELVPLDNLIVMTASAEWLMTTGADEVVAPGKIGFKPQSWFGSSRLAAQVIGENVLYLQGRGGVIRDLGYQFTKDGYTGNDLGIYAAHLLRKAGRTVVDMAFQQVPYNAMHIVTEDGRFFTLTYLREQEVVGWAQHETDGKVFTVCTIPRGSENAVYYGIERVVNGATRRYIEKLHPLTIEDQREAFFVDSGLSFDGRDQAGNQTLTGGTTWLEDEILTLTNSTPFWVGATDQGDLVQLRDETTGEHVDLVVINYVSNTVVEVQSVGTVPATFRNVAADAWDIYRTTLTGLDHLEGMEVAVLGDASVQSRKPVTGGTIELDVPSCIGCVGLPYRGIGESLDINAPGAETVRDRPKLINRVGVLVQDTRGLKVGADLDRLEDVKTEWNDEEDLIPLETGLFEYTIDATWDKNARFMFVQDDPLPCTVLGLIPRVEAGG